MSDVYGQVKNFVQSALDGYNVSLLAYGQTGAGKTHSMLGGMSHINESCNMSMSLVICKYVVCMN